MNFVEAREYLVYCYERSQGLFSDVSESEYLEYRDKICRAQVISLIMDGNFDVAIQVANDDENGKYYTDISIATNSLWDFQRFHTQVGSQGVGHLIVR